MKWNIIIIYVTKEHKRVDQRQKIVSRWITKEYMSTYTVTDTYSDSKDRKQYVYCIPVQWLNFKPHSKLRFFFMAEIKETETIYTRRCTHNTCYWKDFDEIYILCHTHTNPFDPSSYKTKNKGSINHKTVYIWADDLNPLKMDFYFEILSHWWLRLSNMRETKPSAGVGGAEPTKKYVYVMYIGLMFCS